nr:hypothetical protein [uncultured Acinetobacter sp.]
MSKIKRLVIILLLLLLIAPLCLELYKQRVYNQTIKGFCVQSHLGQTVNEISAMIAKSDKLTIDKNSASKIIIFPQKPSLDTSLCQLEIKENKVINIHYPPADHEN